MEIRQEELSDLPLLAQMIQETGLSDLLDKHYPVHGNWRAPSFGKMLTGWLMYIISECDHRLYTVEDWASRHLGVLRGALDCPAFEGSSFQDDRLGKMLERLSDIPRYEAFMGEYTGSLLRLYELPQTVVRVDSFNAPSYRDAVPGGLFQHGYHKSHQPDEPQVKVMAACLDPLAFPVAALSVAGSASDDELYAPVIEQARRVLSPRGLLYVGDVKMGTAATFSLLAGSGNFYLCPLSNAALPKGALIEGIEAARRAGEGQLRSVHRTAAGGQDESEVARVYELPPLARRDPPSAAAWTERRVLVCSLPYAAAQEERLREKIRSAQKELLERFLPRKSRQQWKGAHLAKARAFVDKVLDKNRVRRYLNVELLPTGQDPGKSPLHIRISQDEGAIREKLADAGWRVYATNLSAEQMSPEQMLECYRDEYRIEQQFHKILTKTTALLPINLKKDNRVVALVNIVFLALQFVSIIQYRGRKALEQRAEALADLVPGNKNRKVRRPTAELLLKRFKGVCAVWVKLDDGSTSVTVLHFDPIHAIILNLLRCPDDIYIRCAKNCFQNCQ